MTIQLILSAALAEGMGDGDFLDFWYTPNPQVIVLTKA